MTKTQNALGTSLIIIALVLGIGIGYSLSPEYRQSMFQKNTMGLGVADVWVDQRYLNAMISHHRSAMLIAEQAQQSSRPEIQKLAVDILTNEPKLIEELYTWKKEWYNDMRTVSDPKVPQFGSPNKTFDLRILNALIAHHEDGIVMTQEVRLKTSRSEVVDNADAVEAFLKNSMTMLREWRVTWYGITK